MISVQGVQYNDFSFIIFALCELSGLFSNVDFCLS